MSKKRRGKIYVRVSTKDQMDGLSIDAQIDECRNYAVRNNFKITEIISNGGESVKLDLRETMKPNSI